MTDFLDQVDAAFVGAGMIEKSDLLRWMRLGDLATRARVYALTASARSRIQPEPTMYEQCDFMADYLLECLATNPENGDLVHSGFEAGYTLAAWLKHLVTVPDAAPIVSAVATRLEHLYRRADEETRNRIETGALEHILEEPRLRSYFSHWEEDPILREAHKPALAWGLAHSERASGRPTTELY
jgi:hypothetical protein